MDRTNNMHYIKLMNFNEDANKVFNKALQFASNEKCGEVNIVHLFLAIMEKTEFGNNIMEQHGTSFDMLYDSYQELASRDLYGHTDDVDKLYKMELVSHDLCILFAKTISKAAYYNKLVDMESLIHEMLNLGSEVLNDFLEYVGLDIDTLLNYKDSSFNIPGHLQNFIQDMNAYIADKNIKIDGVDKYTDNIIEILSKKISPNPCLIGESGVGKTTTVYSFVQRIINGNVPDSLLNRHVVYINSALLTSGTRYRGDFEERMKDIIDWASDTKSILFLDELHSFIDLGGGKDSSETAGNMVKKALSDGDIQIIGATTNEEYHKYIEKDSAFNRRLQVINIKEPSVKDTINMLKNTVSEYENFHNVKVNCEQIDLAVELSNRYMKNLHFPYKAYSVLDSACTLAKLSNKKVLEDCDVLSAVSKATSIDVNKLSKSELKHIVSLEEHLSKKLIGQEYAVKTVSKAIKRSKAGVRDSNKPVASFMFVGPTGVGKTELCKVLSEELSLGNESFIKVDMSEFSEKQSISKLIGSAPGYVGYGEGGQLTEKVKHNPNSIVLFDEIEKANPEVFNALLQLLDEGRMTDGEGNTVDFTNCVIVMTSNAGYGAEKIGKGKLGFAISESKDDDPEKIAMEALKETFKPEFLNRLDNIVVFDKLNEEQSKKIVSLLLSKLSDRVFKNNGINITFRKPLINHIASIGFSSEYGARNLKREIQNTVEDFIADSILSGDIVKGDNVTVTWKDNKVSLSKNNSLNK